MKVKGKRQSKNIEDRRGDDPQIAPLRGKKKIDLINKLKAQKRILKGLSRSKVKKK